MSATKLGQWLKQHDWVITTAESCTGGGVAQAITDVAGSSAWFHGGFVTYSNDMKKHLLGVHGHTLTEHGAVSEACVIEMAQGALAQSGADMAVSVSGIAGPDGGSEDKPVGTVWFGLAMTADVAATLGQPQAKAICKHFDGDRQGVRAQAVAFVIGELVSD
jgi:nicotinamide-nucleotide amidase